MPKFLDLILGKGADAIDKIAGAVDKFVYSKEEKNADREASKRATEEAEYRMKSLDQEAFANSLNAYTKLEELEIKDKQSARSRELKIAQEAPNKLWGLTVNITAILAFLILGMTFTLHLLKGVGKISESMDLSTYDHITTFVVAYFFGTSIGSRNKEKILSNISRNGS